MSEGGRGVFAVPRGRVEGSLGRRFEYQVCNVQYGKVTFVNGGWVGSVDPSQSEQDAALNSCPNVWDYLREAGYDGWELVAVAAQQVDQASYQLLYLKRER